MTSRRRTLLLKLAESARAFSAVILGVLGAFWLSAWAEQRRDQRLERFYMEEMRDNLAMDQTRLAEVIRLQSERRANLVRLFEAMPAATEARKPAIDSLFTAVIGNETFFPSTGAYRAMVAEGSLDLIEDKELVTSLVELYEFYYTRLSYLGTVLDEEIARITWEGREFYSLYDLAFVDVEAIRDPRLRSIQEHRWGFVSLYLGHAQDTAEQLARIREQLDAELAR